MDAALAVADGDELVAGLGAGLRQGPRMAAAVSAES